MNVEDDCFPVLLRWVSVRFELDGFPEMLDGKLEYVFFWELVSPIEVIEWLLVV